MNGQHCLSHVEVTDELSLCGMERCCHYSCRVSILHVPCTMHTAHVLGVSCTTHTAHVLGVSCTTNKPMSSVCLAQQTSPCPRCVLHNKQAYVLGVSCTTHTVIDECTCFRTQSDPIHFKARSFHFRIRNSYIHFPHTPPR